jgi:hypothetical protein
VEHGRPSISLSRYKPWPVVRAMRSAMLVRFIFTVAVVPGVVLSRAPM